MVGKNFNLLAKIDRLSAWTLLVGFLAYFISGYGLAKGIIDYPLASFLHLGWLSTITIAAFLFHSGFAIHLALKRWQIWNPTIGKMLIAACLVLFLGFIYLNFFFSEDTKRNTESQISNRNQEESLPTFTAQELSYYNGENGQPAYAAINGLVYDLSPLYQSGDHYGCEAGQDITEKFYQQHSDQILARFDIVGYYSK